jgi:hypothetical protein
MYYYSDDGFVVFKRHGITRIIETDIKSCDASNGPVIFFLVYLLAEWMGYGDSMKVLIFQCSLPTVLFNLANRDDWIKIFPAYFFEYSGSLLTTILNCIASFVMACAWYLEVLKGKDIMIAICDGSSKYGWTVTSADRQTWNQVTFLKRTFNGRVSWICYGTIFRSLGILDGMPSPEKFGLTYHDYVGKTQGQLFKILITQRVQSLVNEPGSIVINALRCYVGMPEVEIEVSVSDLCDRYGCEDYHWQELCHMILSLKVGDVLACPALDAIFLVDYDIV